MTRLTPPTKTHGGKHFLASKIVALMPPHISYVEPFAGGLAVLLAKDPEGVSEVVNDLNGELINFWRVLQDYVAFDALHRRLECTPVSRDEWADAVEYPQDSLRDRVRSAHAFFVRIRQSLAGRGKDFAPLSKTRIRRGMNEQASAWLSAIEGLPAVHTRLKRVVVEHLDATVLIEREDTPDTLFYCDPPYLHETRASPQAYQCEMTDKDHLELLDVLLGCKGKVMLSGYPSEMYDEKLAAWTRHVFDLPNNASGAKTKARKQECLWCNF